MNEMALKLPVCRLHIETSYRATTTLQETLCEESLLPAQAQLLIAEDEQRAFPAIAKDTELLKQIEMQVRRLPTTHCLLDGDSRRIETLPNESVHMVLTSPPYWTLKHYADGANQLGNIADYEQFLSELDRVWQHTYRVLVPGGRLVVVVGDVCVSRKKYGRHLVFPLHASIQEHCRKIGFDNLAPIVWYKISNAAQEAQGNGTSFLGKPYEPGGVIKNDIEYILMQRKGGGYRSPSMTVRALSVISETNHRRWFQQIWDIKGASTRLHPAPFPLELAERLVRMFSFVGDTVLDPFLGTGTTSAAAALWGRNSVGVEVEPAYHEMALARLRKLQNTQMELAVAEEPSA